MRKIYNLRVKGQVPRVRKKLAPLTLGTYYLLLCCLLFVCISCDQSPKASKQKIKLSSQAIAADQPSEDTTNPFKPFYIYSEKGSRENHYVPSGFMPNGRCIEFNDTWTQNCHSGKTCIKIVYDLQCSREDERWAGIYWLNPPNNWGTRKGGFDLTGAKRLTFWAKGNQGGEQIQEFTVGGISGDYPDSDTAVIGPVILSNQWRQYTIDLRGKDLSYISGGFAWTTSEDVNGNACVFYLDDMRFE